MPRGRGSTPIAAPGPGPMAPPAPDDLVLDRAAQILGIMLGDDYGATEADLPDDAPQPIPTTDPPALERGAGDQYSPDALVARGVDPKAVKAPDHGGTIYSGGFAHDLLAALNMPVTFENVRFINAWMKAETGNQEPGKTPAFNPLATTQKYGSYTIFNSHQVKNYADYHTGVMATADVLVRQPAYAQILAALARGTDAMAAARAVEASPWGTGGGVMRVLGAG